MMRDHSTSIIFCMILHDKLLYNPKKRSTKGNRLKFQEIFFQEQN